MDGEPAPLPRRLFDSLQILTVDIGATRTKFMYHSGSAGELLPLCDSSQLWDCPDNASQEEMGALFRSRLTEHLGGQNFSSLDAVIFSVPGTVDIASPSSEDESTCVVRNMPSMSPGFKGFNFKLGFSPAFPNAKIYAVSDNMAAAMGVACMDSYKTTTAGLVITLGTAPSVATFFRGSAPEKASKTVELGIWQSWVWFTKIPLKDPYGYCGGLCTNEDGRTIRLRDPREYKIPHEKARIRFAVDRDTWKRLRGKLDWLDRSLQGNLDKVSATVVWNDRVQSTVDALALRFHQLYGKPDIIVLLGGNSIRCSGAVAQATYTDPDYSFGKTMSVPVYVPPTDDEQQIIHMRGLAQAVAYRISQVYACGADPLARGWTRGGELYLWVKRREII
jgi:hypothetical protein